VSIAVVFTIKVEGGAGEMETEMGGVIVMVAETDFVLLAVEVAVTVTVLPVGIAAGAMNMVALPLVV